LFARSAAERATKAIGPGAAGAGERLRREEIKTSISVRRGVGRLWPEGDSTRRGACAPPQGGSRPPSRSSDGGAPRANGAISLTPSESVHQG